MKRKLSKQWEILLARLEKQSTGATIHDIRLKFCTAKDCIEAWCVYMNGEKPNYEKEQVFEWKIEAIKILMEFGYDDDDFDLFITVVDDE